MSIGSQNSAGTVIDIFCEFIEVAVHNILYIRKLYPDTIFEPKRKYGVVVYHSIHPGVNQYILNCLHAIRFHLKRNQLRSIFLYFHTSEKVVERYNFKIFNFNSCIESDPFLVQLEQYLNNFCLKLHTSLNYLDPLSCESTFSIHLEVTEFSHVEFSQDWSHENFLWINLVESENSFTKIIPLQNIKTDFLNVHTYLEKLC